VCEQSYSNEKLRHCEQSYNRTSNSYLALLDSDTYPDQDRKYDQLSPYEYSVSSRVTDINVMAIIDIVLVGFNDIAVSTGLNTTSIQ